MAVHDLFIPHKAMPQLRQPDYKDDMRAIEIWAKGLKSGGTSGAVQFIASFGASTANTVTIGWGGYFQSTIHIGSFGAFLPLIAGDTGLPPDAFLSGSLVSYNLGGGGGIFIPGAAGAVNFFQAMEIFAPNFTGPTSTISLELNLQAVQLATAVPSANALSVTSHVISLASGAHQIIGAANLNAATVVGTDLSISGTPSVLRSAGGLAYFVSWNILATSWDTANTLTQA